MNKQKLNSKLNSKSNSQSLSGQNANQGSARFQMNQVADVAIRKAFLIEYRPETLRMLRHHRQLTQANLARRANISADYLSELERECSQPSLELMGRLGAALEVIFFK